jgi:hypothetical protein
MTLFSVPPPARTELEERAWALAERAQGVANDSMPRLPTWEDLGDHGQASLANQALTFICLREAYEDPMKGTH